MTALFKKSLLITSTLPRDCDEGEEENIDYGQNILDVEVEVANIVRIWTVKISQEVDVLRNNEKDDACPADGGD